MQRKVNAFKGSLMHARKFNAFKGRLMHAWKFIGSTSITYIFTLSFIYDIYLQLFQCFPDRTGLHSFNSCSYFTFSNYVVTEAFHLTFFLIDLYAI